MLKKLPIGIQTFSKVIEGDYLYIDKTQEALEITQNYQYAFLSRPRRFGKSLFMDTLQELFEGNKPLFKGLYIEDKWDWEKKYPVIKISWDGMLQTLDDLQQKARETFIANQERLGIECETDSSSSVCFERLIREAYKKYQTPVVILIDEYDKAILDVIENHAQAQLHREFIKGLYSVIKGCDRYVKFAFLTGVSKFSKASIFSGLNMLEDISLTPRFGNICGYTQRDVESTFLPYLKGVDLEKVKVWYNGYNFLKDDVYNPFDMLKFIKNDFKYSNYWFASGTPTFLIKLIEKNNYFLPKLTNITMGEELLESFDIDNIDLEVILYQSGYLTIESIQTVDMGFTTERGYRLKIPNIEVKLSLNNFIIQTLFEQNPTINKAPLYQSLANKDMKAFEATLKSIFASIPYNNFTKNSMQNYEGFYASVIYVYLQSLGIEIIGEDVTNKGRIDLTLFVGEYIYILEFKVDGKGNALEQIKEKNYAQKYTNKNREIILVGINFDTKEKNVSELGMQEF